MNIGLLLLDKAINLCEEIEISNGSSYHLYHILTSFTPTSKLKRLTFRLIESPSDEQLENEVIKVHPDATLQFLALLYFDRCPVNIGLLFLDKAINLCEEIEISNGSSYHLYHILTSLTPTSKLKRLTFRLIESPSDEQLENEGNKSSSGCYIAISCAVVF